MDLVSDELHRLHRSLEMLLRETSPEEPTRREFDLDEVARAFAALIETQARQHNVTVNYVRGADAPVVSRQDRIREATLILAINALEAMPGGGTLRIFSGANDGWSVLEVADTGCGIPAEILPRIFDLHFTTKPLGTGVGLWAARSIAQSEMANLGVVVTGPSGTTFRIAFPPHTSEE